MAINNGNAAVHIVHQGRMAVFHSSSRGRGERGVQSVYSPIRFIIGTINTSAGKMRLDHKVEVCFSLVISVLNSARVIPITRAPRPSLWPTPSRIGAPAWPVQST